MTDRLSSSMLVGALLRRTQAEGGFGVVLEKGDESAGAVAVVLTEKGGNPRFFERLLQPDGRYSWQESRQLIENEEELRKFLASRRNFDPDLWILELDIASAERFAAEMNAIG